MNRRWRLAGFHAMVFCALAVMHVAIFAEAILEWLMPDTHYVELWLPVAVGGVALLSIICSASFAILSRRAR